MVPLKLSFLPYSIWWIILIYDPGLRPRGPPRMGWGPSRRRGKRPTLPPTGGGRGTYMYIRTHTSHTHRGAGGTQRGTTQEPDNQGSHEKPVHPYPLVGGWDLQGWIIYIFFQDNKIGKFCIVGFNYFEFFFWLLKSDFILIWIEYLYFVCLINKFELII